MYNLQGRNIILISMSAGSSLSNRIWYTRKALWRRSRLLYPSPAEARFVRIMGGKTITIKFIRARKTRFPFVLFLSMGRTLRREYVQRELRVGAYYIDFAFITRDAKRGIEIDGRAYHLDILKEQERDEYLQQRGWEIMHITASELHVNPGGVRERVLQFLAR